MISAKPSPSTVVPAPGERQEKGVRSRRPRSVTTDQAARSRSSRRGARSQPCRGENAVAPSRKRSGPGCAGSAEGGTVRTIEATTAVTAPAMRIKASPPKPAAQRQGDRETATAKARSGRECRGANADLARASRTSRQEHRRATLPPSRAARIPADLGGNRDDVATSRFAIQQMHYRAALARIKGVHRESRRRPPGRREPARQPTPLALSWRPGRESEP